MIETPNQSSSWGSLFAGMVVGAVLGAAVSLMYAPKPGKETREELLERLDEVKTRLDETARIVADATKDRLAETRSDLSQAIEAGREAARAKADELRRQAGLG